MNIAYFCHTFPFPPQKDRQTVIAYNVLRELTRRHTVSLTFFGAAGDGYVANNLRFSSVTACESEGKGSIPLFYLSGRSRNHAWFEERYRSTRFLESLCKADDDPAVGLLVLRSST